MAKGQKQFYYSTGQAFECSACGYKVKCRSEKLGLKILDIQK